MCRHYCANVVDTWSQVCISHLWVHLTQCSSISIAESSPMTVLLELVGCCLEKTCSLSEPDLSAVPCDILREVRTRLLRGSAALLEVLLGAAARGELCAVQVLYNKLCYQPTGKGKLLKLQTTGSP